jgi:hypothetical protein
MKTGFRNDSFIRKATIYWLCMYIVLLTFMTKKSSGCSS